MNVKWLWNPCSRHEQDLSLLAAGMLSETDRPALEAHLAKCPACRSRLAATRRLTARLATVSKSLPQATPSPSLRHRWRRAVLGEHQAAPKRSPALLPFQLPWGLPGGRLAWGSAAACWMLILFLRVTAPSEARPAIPLAPVSWREVVLALEQPPPPRLKHRTAAKNTRPSQPAWPRSGRTTRIELG
jgi:anti-sigma factor RsiW